MKTALCALLLLVLSVPSARARDAGPGAVTLEQVLADPDNIELNYGYARSLVEKGDLKGAMAALERVLGIDPDLHEIRFFYAMVLYRLDLLAEAEREVELLSALPVPRELRAQIEDTRREARRRRKRTQLSGALSLGFEYDDNRNAGPTSGHALFLDTPLTLSDVSQKRGDTNMLYLGSVELRRDLGGQAGHELFASLNYYRAEQAALKNLNLQAYSPRAGATLKLYRFDLTPSLLFDHVLLAQTSYLRNRGASLRLEAKGSARLRPYVEERAVYQDFSPTALVPNASDRSGNQIESIVGCTYLMGPSARVGAEFNHTVKNAARRFDAFRREAAGLNGLWLLGRGTFLSSSATFGYDQYDQADAFVSQTRRIDKTLRVNLAYGVPLSAIGRSLRDLLWTAAYEYYRDDSNLPNFTFANNKVSTVLTYKWALGF